MYTHTHTHTNNEPAWAAQVLKTIPKAVHEVLGHPSSHHTYIYMYTHTHTHTHTQAINEPAWAAQVLKTIPKAVHEVLGHLFSHHSIHIHGHVHTHANNRRTCIRGTSFENNSESGARGSRSSVQPLKTGLRRTLRVSLNSGIRTHSCRLRAMTLITEAHTCLCVCVCMYTCVFMMYM